MLDSLLITVVLNSKGIDRLGENPDAVIRIISIKAITSTTKPKGVTLQFPFGRSVRGGVFDGARLLPDTFFIFGVLPEWKPKLSVSPRRKLFCRLHRLTVSIPTIPPKLKLRLSLSSSSSRMLDMIITENISSEDNPTANSRYCNTDAGTGNLLFLAAQHTATKPK